MGSLLGTSTLGREYSGGSMSALSPPDRQERMVWTASKLLIYPIEIDGASVRRIDAVHDAKTILDEELRIVLETQFLRQIRAMVGVHQQRMAFGSLAIRLSSMLSK